MLLLLLLQVLLWMAQLQGGGWRRNCCCCRCRPPARCSLQLRPVKTLLLLLLLLLRLHILLLLLLLLRSVAVGVWPCGPRRRCCCCRHVVELLLQAWCAQLVCHPSHAGQQVCPALRARGVELLLCRAPFLGALPL
jgi:hypothetical protein